MFGHQYSAIWIDFRGIKDEFMWPLGIDYFENSRRAVLSQRAYAIRNPLDWRGYGPNIWGITACDGPGDFKLPYLGQTRQFRGYAARGVGLPTRPEEIFDDGTIAPTAAIASLPFAEEIVVPAAHEMHKRYGQNIYGKYGFVDAFNPSFDFDVPLQARQARARRRLGRQRLSGHRPGRHHLDDRESPQRAHLARHETQPAHPPRPRACGLRRRLAQPTLSASSGARPTTDSSVSTKLVCQASIELTRSTSSIAW